MKIPQSYIDAISGGLDWSTPRQHVGIYYKSDGSPVSAVDLESESIGFAWASRNFPNFFVLSEENHHGIEFDYKSSVIVIDPIDGTENYISGIPLWASGVSVFEHGTHIYSAIVAPAMGMRLESPELDSNKEVKKHSSRVVGFSSSTRPSAIPDEVGEYRVFGCSMLNFLFVIQGSFSEFRNDAGGHCWDILPGLNLALAAGLDVTVEGRPYRGEFLPPVRKYKFVVSNQFSEGD